MLASAYPVFFSQAMETIGAELTQEMKHPAYAFTGFQLAMKKSMWEQHFGAAINSPSGLPVYPSDSDDSLEDSEEYLSWTVLFPHEVESSPSFLPCTFFNLQFAAHFVPPLYSTVDASPNSTPSISPAPLSLGSSESSASFHASSHLSSSASASQAAASQRLMRVASMLSSVTGKSFAELPRTNVTILQSLEPAAPSVQALFATHGQSDSGIFDSFLILLVVLTIYLFIHRRVNVVLRLAIYIAKSPSSLDERHAIAFVSARLRSKD
jgi:hypothetical protein